MVRKERAKALYKERQDGKCYIIIGFPTGQKRKVEVDKNTYERTMVVGE